jgi:hypothetical protein
MCKHQAHSAGEHDSRRPAELVLNDLADDGLAAVEGHAVDDRADHDASRHEGPDGRANVVIVAAEPVNQRTTTTSGAKHEIGACLPVGRRAVCGRLTTPVSETTSSMTTLMLDCLLDGADPRIQNGCHRSNPVVH